MFLKQVTITSPFAAEEIISRLKKITKTGHLSNKYKSRFEGVIQENQFLIYPLFEYQSMYRFRPEINGLLYENQNGTTSIQLTFRLSSGIEKIFIVGIILNISIMTYLILEPSKNDFIFNWKVFGVLLFSMFALFWGDYNYKVNEIMRLLNHKFRAIYLTQDSDL